MASACGPGCESGSALRNVEVTFRFENVRRQQGLDEWTSIRPILEAHSVRPVVDNQKPPQQPRDTPKPGDGASPSQRNDIRTVQASVVIGSLNDLDKIQADLEDLSQTRIRGERVQFSLVGLSATYRSNAVAAIATVTISGVASPGFLIKLYAGVGGVPLRTTAGGGGLWSVRLASVPDERFVYGVSLDPSRKVQPRYFRVNVSTLRQEAVEEEEFLGRHPAGADPAEGLKAPLGAKKPA